MDHIERLARLLTPTGVLIVIIVAGVLILAVLAAIVALGYMVLDFGDRVFEHARAYIRIVVRLLAHEPREEHPVIRLELFLHILLALIIVFCIAVIAAHTLAPWGSEHVNQIMAYVLAGAFSMFVFLAFVSLRLVIHLGTATWAQK